MLRTWVLVSYRTETFSKSHCAINIITPIDFKDWLKAIACDRPGKANDLHSGTKQTEFALEIFWPPSHKCSQQSSSNEYQSPISPASIQDCTQLLHVPPSFTPRKGKRSPQPSVTAPKVSAKRAGEKRHNIFSNRSTFGSLKEADGVVVNSSAILNTMQMSEDDKKKNMLKKRLKCQVPSCKPDYTGHGANQQQQHVSLKCSSSSCSWRGAAMTFTSCIYTLGLLLQISATLPA